MKTIAQSNQLCLDLHPNQLIIHRSPARLKAINAARGFGKSRLLLIDTIIRALSYDEPLSPLAPKVAAIVMPSLVMAKAIHWLPLVRLLENSPLVEDINRSDYRITFKGNRPDLLLRGADRQGDRLRGLDLIYAGIDEFQDMHPDVFPTVLMPALGRNKGWRAMAIGTPKGKNSYFYKFCRTAYKTPGYRYFHFTSADNPFFPAENLARAKLMLPPRTYRQEHEASWEELEGAILPEFTESNVIKAIPSDEEVICFYMGVDWGEYNAYLSVVALTQKGRFYVVDAWENPNPTTPVPEDDVLNEAARLCHKWSVFRVYAPDDRPASIMAMKRKGMQLDIPGMKRAVVVPRHEPGQMQRYSIMDSLLYQSRLYLVEQSNPYHRSIKQDITSFHRAKSREGYLVNEPAPNQRDHSIDAISHVVSHLEYKLGPDRLTSAA